MTKGKDFYGTEIAEVIEEACKEFGLPREQLDIAVLATGSTGIFGLCKKKAHIRVQIKKGTARVETDSPAETKVAPPQSEEQAQEQEKRQGSNRSQKKRTSKKTSPKTENKADLEKEVAQPVVSIARHEEEEVVAVSETTSTACEEGSNGAPTAEALAIIAEKLGCLLDRMGLSSAVQVEYTDSTILCSISGEHASYLAGQDGKILDSLQYLLRKMIGAHLPERATLSLDAAGYREQRMERLKEQAAEFAEEVRETGKTKAISGLNPAERRAIHMALQQDAEVRSRSVGSGLFKKILIYKAGKETKPAASKRRSGAGERQNNS